MNITWSPGVTLDQMEQMIIVRAMKHYDNNKTKTASALGIAIRTLDAKLEKYAEESKHVRPQHGPSLNEMRYGKDLKGYGAPASLQAERGLHVEPVKEVPSEQSLSMREREEVQEMPPSKHASGSSNRRR